ncbi:glycosyltransferase family 2 protein [Sphingomonas sp. URHD0057]|uniref:glycosyltransferase family 2 protein n=1 Tax=Sphingomonas sp. URHD0057 TaxID=1380389 RepID=UPI0006890D59|nr:glycosyltransferase family 2 protein [Sphingomonas sp. URHD0057]
MPISCSEKLVSVVVPAYNGEATLSETLWSARAQTHAQLEVIVVDDGSTDRTPEIVQSHANADPRIRYVRQDNAGVAAARNTGARLSKGEFLAPIDSDDLWHKTKIERQLEAFEHGAPEVGVVYTWFALIDDESRIIHTKHSPDYAGWVLPVLAEFNFVGNGSAPLIRMDAFRNTSGYDPSLRGRGGEGCEDWKLYCELAEKYQYAVVPSHLTGYRSLPHNMSANVAAMLRSRDLATADLLPRHPELKSKFHLGRNRLSRFMLHRALRRGGAREISRVIRAMASFDPKFLGQTIAGLPFEISELVRSKYKAEGVGRNPHYAEFLVRCRA